EETQPAPRQVIDRDSSPGLPSPPEAKPAARMLDTSPSPRTESPTLSDRPGERKQNLEGSTTMLGLEPARVETSARTPSASVPPLTKEQPARAAAEGRATPRAIAVETTRPVK